MRIYLDENMLARQLVALLGKAGHQVIRSTDVGMRGRSDPDHLLYAIQHQQVFLTHNHKHFEQLHALVIGSGGHHSGILTVRYDNDPSRDMKPAGIVSAIRKLESAGVPIADCLHVLNQWR